MEECFPMKGGNGAYSYAKNSHYQKLATDAVKEKIQAAVIENLDTQEILTTTTTTTAISIADLGCSIGPNTFFAVQYLIQAVQNKFCDSKNDLEFQVFFNDHSANDFNTLFASLPPERQYHAAGVPGSFYGRLFPRASISIAHSSHALHWLSKLPQGVHNEGRIHYLGAPEDVVRAYSDQFERDLGVFMNARAEEIVSGGLMLLTLPGAPDDDGDGDGNGNEIPHLEFSVIFDFFVSSLMDLVDQGVVEKGEVDGFNLPFYFPKVGEMKKVIEKNGCFRIERMELIDTRPKLQGLMNAATMLKHMRAGSGGVLTSYFGNSVVEQLFDNVSAKTEEISRCIEAHNNSPDQLFVVLKRK